VKGFSSGIDSGGVGEEGEEGRRRLEQGGFIVADLFGGGKQRVGADALAPHGQSQLRHPSLSLFLQTEKKIAARPDRRCVRKGRLMCALLDGPRATTHADGDGERERREGQPLCPFFCHVASLTRRRDEHAGRAAGELARLPRGRGASHALLVRGQQHRAAARFYVWISVTRGLVAV